VKKQLQNSHHFGSTFPVADPGRYW